MSLTQSKQRVKLINPPSWVGRADWTHERCQRFLRNHTGAAKFDALGRFVFLLSDPDIVTRRLARQHNLKAGPSLNIVEVDHFCGQDARPGRPVLPPSAEVLGRLSSARSRYISPAEAMSARNQRMSELLDGMRSSRDAKEVAQ